MEDWTTRTVQLLSAEGVARLQQAKVLVVGTGGVGAYAAEMLCRAGVGAMTLIDGDVVAPSNINRQLIATHATVGKPKAALLGERLREINPDLKLEARSFFLEPEAMEDLLKEGYDYVVDAIDTLLPKITLIEQAVKGKTKIISSMGAGGRVDPTQIRYADISETYHCGLAKAVRKGLQQRGIRKGLKVVFSTEQADRNSIVETQGERYKKSTVGTLSYMPALFGCYLAAYVIRKLTQK